MSSIIKKISTFVLLGLISVSTFPEPQDESDNDELMELRAAAEQGDPFAQFSLGSEYYSLSEEPRDDTEAMKWFRKSAEQGFVAAQSMLGLMYYDSQMYHRAVTWYRMAAEQGHEIAQYRLGNLYYNGQGVPQNYTEAAKWYRAAAEQGDHIAQFKLGTLYHNGQGVPQDYKEAYIWTSLSAIHGYADAIEARDRAARRLSASELSEAQEEATRRHASLSRVPLPKL